MKPLAWVFAVGTACTLSFGLASESAAQGGPPDEDDLRQYEDEKRRGVLGRRTAEIPPGHLPPPGECKRWDPDLPPGQQPPPVSCDALVGAALGDDLIVTHTGVYDPDHDWDEDEVPSEVWRILQSL